MIANEADFLLELARMTRDYLEADRWKQIYNGHCSEYGEVDPAAGEVMRRQVGQMRHNLDMMVRRGVDEGFITYK